MIWIGVAIGTVLGAALGMLAGRWRTRRFSSRVGSSTSDRRQQQLAELGTLTGGLAHEIKNPLSTIKVNLQLLTEDLDSPSASQQQLRWLRRLRAAAGEVSRLQEVLDDFLRFAGKHELTIVRADLREIVSDLADFFTPQAEGEGVRVRTSLSDQPVLVNVDPALLKQALLNLMINAQQAMPDGGELILKVTRSRRRATVEVIDTGVGMDEDVQRQIFQAYYTTKRGGTGLGLSTALRIVREHHGQVRVDSTPGKGTRFTIDLPAGRE